MFMGSDVFLYHRLDLNGGRGEPMAIAADYLETVIVRA
jgi:hypothetical protein